MSDLTTYQQDFKLDSLTTDEALEKLESYGSPRLGKYDGWHCAINVFVTGKGVSFEVKTDFKQSSPNLAARECLRLLFSALKDIKETK